MDNLLFDGPEDAPLGDAPLTIALAHGAGAAMDTPFMAFFAEGLAERGFRAVRFEFPYMAERRRTGVKRPPDRAPLLLETWKAVIEELGPERLIIGGKSLGGRMASMVADEAGVRGLVCLGYPFHAPGRPPERPEGPRIDHLKALKTPALILQGARDTLGSHAEVPSYPLSAAIRLHWLGDGDHGFKPRTASGRTERQNWDEAVGEIAAFISSL
ncbi:MAG TPA: alpha/beta fold hydrolase [Rhodospirillales bacterium]|nr:alpha/beta fold hydrolase [Rhodospirillales bacterium]